MNADAPPQLPEEVSPLAESEQEPSVARMDRTSFLIFPLLILSQFAGASLWFAPNPVLGDLQRE